MFRGDGITDACAFAASASSPLEGSAYAAPASPAAIAVRSRNSRRLREELKSIKS